MRKLFLVLNLLRAKHLLVLKIRRNKRLGKNAVTLYGTVHDKVQQIYIMQRMIDSLQLDLTDREREKLRTLSPSTIPHAHPDRLRQPGAPGDSHPSDTDRAEH
jgi:hypothetical protein